MCNGIGGYSNETFFAFAVSVKKKHHHPPSLNCLQMICIQYQAVVKFPIILCPRPMLVCFPCPRDVHRTHPNSPMVPCWISVNSPHCPIQPMSYHWTIKPTRTTRMQAMKTDHWARMRQARPFPRRAPTIPHPHPSREQATTSMLSTFEAVQARWTIVIYCPIHLHRAQHHHLMDRHVL